MRNGKSKNKMTETETQRQMIHHNLHIAQWTKTEILCDCGLPACIEKKRIFDEVQKHIREYA
jgi:hypothetical protein